jgi:hypothetical protein
VVGDKWSQQREELAVNRPGLTVPEVTQFQGATALKEQRREAGPGQEETFLAPQS